MTDLIVTQQQSIFEMSPTAKITYATEIANQLNLIIENKKLYKQFGKTKHIEVTGWSTLGTLLGILPKEEKVIEHEDGTYEAHVSLVNLSGVVVGGSSSICGTDEPNWRGKPKYARRSMAITRATGKAYRLAFGWITVLAGYSATPAEEMPIDDIEKIKSEILTLLLKSTDTEFKMLVLDTVGKAGDNIENWKAIEAKLRNNVN